MAHNLQDKLKLSLQISEGIAFLHYVGVVHRDIIFWFFFIILYSG